MQIVERSFRGVSALERKSTTHYRWLTIGLVLIVMMLPSVVLAGHTSGTVKGALSSQSNGACDVGYSSLCPSGDCVCDIFTGSISGSPIGKGQAQLWITIDNGAALSPDRRASHCSVSLASRPRAIPKPSTSPALRVIRQKAPPTPFRVGSVSTSPPQAEGHGALLQELLTFPLARVSSNIRGLLLESIPHTHDRWHDASSRTRGGSRTASDAHGQSAQFEHGGFHQSSSPGRR